MAANRPGDWRDVEMFSALRDLPSEALAAFCLGCAERGSGVLIGLADPEELEWSARVLDVAWKAPLGETDEDELIEIMEDFELRAESVDADDPGSKGFYVVQSSMLAVNAIAVYLNPSPARAEMSGQTLETILGSFDFKLGGSETVIIGSGEEQAVGRLQRLEQEAQDLFIESVRNRHEAPEVVQLDADFLETLRNSCGAVLDDIAAAAESIAELAGWGDE